MVSASLMLVFFLLGLPTPAIGLGSFHTFAFSFSHLCNVSCVSCVPFTHSYLIEEAFLVCVPTVILFAYLLLRPPRTCMCFPAECDNRCTDNTILVGPHAFLVGIMHRDVRQSVVDTRSSVRFCPRDAERGTFAIPMLHPRPTFPAGRARSIKWTDKFKISFLNVVKHRFVLEIFHMLLLCKERIYGCCFLRGSVDLFGSADTAFGQIFAGVA